MRYNTEFNPLFKVKFLHEFFDNPMYPKMEVLPLPCTRRMFEQNELGWRVSGNEVLIYYKVEPTKKVSIEHLKKGLLLSFVLVPKDPNYWLMTNVSQLSLGENYIFSNLEPLLTRQEGGVIPQVKLSEIEPRKFLTPGRGLEPFLKNLDSAVTVKHPVDDEVIGSYDGGVDRASLFQDFPDNCDWVSVESKGETWSASPFEIPADALGIFSFGLDPANDQYSFETLKDSEFHIVFEPRSVFWRYHIIPRKGGDFRDYRIQNGKQDGPFDEGEMITMRNGQEAYRMTSNEPISLKQTYEGGYRLEVKKFDTGFPDEGQLLRFKLPTPEVDKIKMQRQENEIKAYSDIYLYI